MWMLNKLSIIEFAPGVFFFWLAMQNKGIFFYPLRDIEAVSKQRFRLRITKHDFRISISTCLNYRDKIFRAMSGYYTPVYRQIIPKNLLCDLEWYNDRENQNSKTKSWKAANTIAPKWIYIEGHSFLFEKE